MNLNELRDKAYQCAIAHGWHEEEHSNEHWLCLIISELMEAVQSDRIGKRAGRKEFESFPSHISFNLFIKDSVEDELADAVIRLLDLAGLRGIDLNLAMKDLNNNIDDMSEACKDETFIESIYAISTLPARYDGLYDFPTTVNDMIMSVFELAKYIGIDLLWHIEQKMKYNELRPYKHSNKKY